ncbi:unnamed protein product [Victoria cruziana]
MINPSALFFLLLSHSSSLLLVAAQSGFLSIDCGLPDGSNNTSDNGLYYVSDNGFIDSGANKQIDPALKNISDVYQTLRFFPDYKRNCYTLPAERGGSYLVRAYFMHGKYDGASINATSISFDLYLGVDLWDTIMLHNSTHKYWTEFGCRANTTTISVCLVKTTAAVPFISALELRPLKDLLYTSFTASASFTTFRRVDVGATEQVRYPYDPYDRLWRPDNSSYGTTISTNDAMKDQVGPSSFGLPSAVMRTAGVSSRPIVITWPGGSDARYHLAMHFAELQRNRRRNLTIKMNGDDWYSGLIPDYLDSESVYSTQPLFAANYSFSVERDHNSKHGPILNAFEVFKVVRPSGYATQALDVEAINAIKNYYLVQRNWNGDPCLPQNFPWDGLTCSYDNSSAARIVSLDLSNSRLQGVISESISQLTALQELNLSRNNLNGSIPSSLQELHSLSNLDLSSNNLSGPVPSALQQRADSGMLILSIDTHINPQICQKEPCGQDEKSGKNRKKRNIIIAAVVAATLVALISLSAAFIIMKKKRKPQQDSN